MAAQAPLQCHLTSNDDLDAKLATKGLKGGR
jgi:hypothetical protein